MMSEKENHKAKELAKTAVAVVTATGVALGGAFGGEVDTGHDAGPGESIVEMLNPDTDETDEGLLEEEKRKKGGRRSVVRALSVGVPMAALCWWAVAALCALLPQSLPLFLLTACKWILTAGAALLALSVTLKAAAPEEPIITTLHKSYKRTLLLCLLFCCGEGAVLWFFPAQAGHMGEWLRLTAISAVLMWLTARALKRDKTPPKEERPRTDRERVMELANSVKK